MTPRDEMRSAAEHREEGKLDVNRTFLRSLITSACYLGALAERGSKNPAHYEKTVSPELEDFANAVKAAIEDHLEPAYNLVSGALDEIDAAEERKHRDIERDVIRRAQAGGV